MSCITQSTTLQGAVDSGAVVNAALTPEGHQECAIHDPLLPFGSVHVESLTPVFQTDAVYGLNDLQTEASTSLSGAVSASDSLFTCSTGTTIYSLATLQSRKRLRYRPGQGIVCRFTAKFTTGVANSYQVAGIGHAEDGLYFGYKNAQFGILYNNRGARECRTLTITTASSTNENVTVTLNGTAYTVAVTNSANIQRTVYELSRGTYAGWDAEAVGATVVFLNNSAGAKSGTYSLTASTAVGAFAQTKAGAATTELFIPQTSFNGDKLDGTGASGFTLDPTKGNVYQLGIQYLGFGTLTAKVETTTAGNNSIFTTVHSIKLPNTLTASSFRNPSFPFTMASYSAGSTTNLQVSTASFAGFIEGAKMLHGNRYSYFNQSTSVGAANYTVLFTVYNRRYYGSLSNQSVISIMSLSAALKHTSPCIIYLVRNATLAGNPNFASFSSTSCSLYDTAATTLTFSDNSQVLWSGHLGDTGNIDHNFTSQLEDFTLQPGDMLSVCAKAVTGSPAYVTASLNCREDQ